MLPAFANSLFIDRHMLHLQDYLKPLQILILKAC
jgi:hypothetical protein